VSERASVPTETSAPAGAVQSETKAMVFVSYETLMWLIDEMNRYSRQARGLLKMIESNVAELDEERQRSARLEARVNCLTAVETRLRQRLVALQNRLEDAVSAAENQEAEKSAGRGDVDHPERRLI